jgi:hypothetical protein
MATAYWLRPSNLEKHHQSGNVHVAAVELADDGVGGWPVLSPHFLVPRPVVLLERGEHEALILASETSCPTAHSFNPRVLRGCVHHLLLEAHHFIERGVLGRFRAAKREARIHRRHETLGHYPEHVDGDDREHDRNRQGRPAVTQHYLETAAIAIIEPVKKAFRPLVNAAAVHLFRAGWQRGRALVVELADRAAHIVPVRPQPQAAKHGCEGERNHA